MRERYGSSCKQRQHSEKATFFNVFPTEGANATAREENIQNKQSVLVPENCVVATEQKPRTTGTQKLLLEDAICAVLPSPCQGFGCGLDGIVSQL